MSNEPNKKSNNSFSKSMKYIITQAKQGSKLHIAMIAGAVLLVILLIAFIVNIFSSPKVENDKPADHEIDQEYDKDRESLDVEQLGNTILEETKDAGQEYIDNTLFIGDSNTVRTQAYGHTTWNNVVAAVSMGIEHVPTLKMTFFKGYKSPVTVAEAVKIIQPQRIVITYGTNNTVGYKTEDFIKMYKKALDTITKEWPYADIIINAIPPVDKDRENPAIKMQTIDEYNKELSKLAKEEGYKFLNSSEALKDENTGFAKKDYTIGDGVHLSKKGMDAFFEYVRTHAFIGEDKRPKPLKPIPERDETPTGIIEKDPIAVRGTRIKITFKSSDSELGKVEGEVEQKLKRTITSQAVTAVPNVENGGVFTGWSCSHEGLSSTKDKTVTYKVPKVGEDVTEIVITANFAKAGLNIQYNDKTIQEISLNKGEKKELKIQITGKFENSPEITWQSEDNNIVKVNENGVIEAVNGGKTQIYASILDGKIYAVCTVTVKQGLEEIKVHGESTMKVGSTQKLNLKLLPEGASADLAQVNWSSSDENIVKVTQGGNVTAVNEGNATITAKLGGHTSSLQITVSKDKPLESISIQGKTEMFEGEKTQLTVVYNPENTTDSKKATWESKNTAVASVVDGTVFANEEGTTEIICTVGNKTASITITVKKEANYVSSVSISQTSASVQAGSSVTLTATPVLFDPSRPDGVDVSQSWSSANGYVTVSDGVVTAKSDLTSETGTLTDTVTVSIGGKSATCTITITGVTVPQPERTPTPAPSPMMTPAPTVPPEPVIPPEPEAPQAEENDEDSESEQSDTEQAENEE